MLNLKHTLLLLVAVTVVLAACSGSGGDDALVGGGGDVAQGRSLYQETVIGPNSAPGCVTCHSLDPGVNIVGPSHSDVAARAAETIESSDYTGNARTVEEYLRESIVDPNLHIETGFPAAVMYAAYGEDLSDQEIDLMVAFLRMLK